MTMTLTPQEEAELQWLLQGMHSVHSQQNPIRADIVHDLEHNSATADHSAAAPWPSSPSTSPPNISYNEAVTKVLRRKQQNREAQRKCRDRQKDMIAGLNERLRLSNGANSELQAKVRELSAECGRLRAENAVHIELLQSFWSSGACICENGAGAFDAVYPPITNTANWSAQAASTRATRL